MSFPVKQGSKPTRLALWMKANRHTAPSLALAISNRLNTDYFSASTVRQWKKGISCPRRNGAAMQALSEITEGAITYEMIDGDRRK